MLKHFILILCIAFAGKAAAQENVRMVSFDEIRNLMNRNTDTTYVINFWATWCNPCVHELPNFVKLDSMYKNTKVKVYLVSLDAPKEIDTRLKPFVKKNHIRGPVWLLKAPDSWIDDVDSSWDGTIPSTLVINNKIKMRQFTEKELSMDALNNMVSPFVTKNR
jgi:thiol-disulfide isomerase/thioredoxin